MRLFRHCLNKAQGLYGTQNWVKTVNRAQTIRRNFDSNHSREKPKVSASSNVAESMRQTIGPTNPELENVFQLHGTDTSTWIIENAARAFCAKYVNYKREDRYATIRILARNYGVQHEYAQELAGRLSQIQWDSTKELIGYEKQLKAALTPVYYWLFVILGRLEHGVKFLVDLRTDVLELQASTPDRYELFLLVQLNNTLQELLFQWFSVGFLHLERVTWESPCDIIQKVSEYEAIHPVKGWLDIKRRVGPYRRCYIFTHPSMPREPIVVLHTALCDTILASVQEVEDSKTRIVGSVIKDIAFIHEDKSKITTAVFYSVSSTQKGLLGIQLGNYIIKQVVSKITSEFPKIHQFSSLSPIPGFKEWFLEKVENDISCVLFEHEINALKEEIPTENVNKELGVLFRSASWRHKPKIADILKRPFLRACAYYLYSEKKNTYALNRVANFHLRNGAMIWRINWMANPSLKGTVQSFCLMVNYRYFLEQQEEYGKEYMSNGIIHASDDVLELVKEANELMQRDNNDRQ